MVTVKLRVDFAPGSSHEPGTYPLTPVVQVAFEREYKVGIARAFSEDTMKQEYVYWLGWKAMHAAGKTVKPFDQWLGDLTAVEIVNEAVGPTVATL